MNNAETNQRNIAFYTSEAYCPEIDLNAGTVIIKSDFKTAKKKISSWKKKGYSVHFSVNLSWGDFSEYLNGKYDDINHWDEVQTDKDGKVIFHGPNIPYIVPTVAFNNYLLTKLLPIIDYGVDAIHIEEPYFFVKSGYSNAFKKEWGLYFKKPYSPVGDDINSQYLASVLKGKLIYRSIAFLATALKSYAKYHTDKDLKILVQTRGFLGNIHSKTITPIKKITESRYIDGIVVEADSLTQIISEDAKTNTRLFEAAFIEFNSMKECLRFDDKEIWFAFDSLHKNPLATWKEHLNDFLTKFCAALLVPDVKNYVMAKNPENEYLHNRTEVPHEYSEMLQNFINTLSKPKEANKQIWEGTDDNPIGIFISDNSMYQQVYPADDAYGNINRKDINDFNDFYGLAHPFFSNGQKISMIPVEHVISDTRYLNNYNVMLLSYDFMKPSRPSLHYAINEWVRSGGVLVVAGTDNDSYNNLDSWWNTAPNNYKNPMQHLFEMLGVTAKVENLREKIKKTSRFSKIFSDGIFPVGNGVFAYFPERPARCMSDELYSNYLREFVFAAVAKKKISFIEKAHYSLRKGPYKVVADISNGNSSYAQEGLFCDLISPSLALTDKISLAESPYLFVYDLKNKHDVEFDIIAASGKVSDLKIKENDMTFKIKTRADTDGHLRFYYPDDCTVEINGEETEIIKEDRQSNTFLIKIPGDEKPLTVKVKKIRKTV